MAEVKIRKLPDWVVAHHRRNAERGGRSLEEELRQFLTQDALDKRDRLWNRLAETRAKIRKRHGVVSDSTDDIRDERERLG
jgi:plasmid stability protein